MDVTDLSFLVGQAVEQIWVWGPVRLVFSTADPESYVDVHEPRYVEPGGGVIIVDFVKTPSEAAVILQLLWKKATAAQAVDGVLRVEFETGAVIEEAPDQRYESWSVVGGGRSLQCLPGGEVVNLAAGESYVIDDLIG